MKTITIRLPDVEAAMLVELQKKSPDLKNIESYLGAHIRELYSARFGTRQR